MNLLPTGDPVVGGGGGQREVSLTVHHQRCIHSSNNSATDFRTKGSDAGSSWEKVECQPP